jgi:DNA-binding NarL/FixJ family response regulator
MQLPLAGSRLSARLATKLRIPQDQAIHPMIRIVIVDDHAILRAGLRQYFSEQVDLRVTGEAANGREALDLVRQGDLDVLVMDISMPDQSGIDALAAIKARAPELPVLILSGFPEAHYATALLKQGASGYLNKECDPEEIIKAVRTLYRGRKYITAGVAELLADGLDGKTAKLPHEQLSEREFQVFLRLAKGETIGHMAESLFLSVKTVSTYRTRVMEKMNLASNSDLTYYAMKNGLIQ